MLRNSNSKFLNLKTFNSPKMNRLSSPKSQRKRAISSDLKANKSHPKNKKHNPRLREMKNLSLKCKINMQTRPREVAGVAAEEVASKLKINASQPSNNREVAEEDVEAKKFTTTRGILRAPSWSIALEGGAGVATAIMKMTIPRCDLIVELI